MLFKHRYIYHSILNFSIVFSNSFIFFLQIDAPVTPGSKGLLYFKERISDDMKQQLRERVFDCRKEDIISVCTMYGSFTYHNVIICFLLIYFLGKNVY